MLKPVESLPVGKAPARISLSILMALAFGGLVAISVGAVLFLSVNANFANTFSLLNQRTLEIVAGLERSIKDEAQQAERGVNSLAQFHAKGNLAISQNRETEIVLEALLRSLPIVEAILLVDRATGTQAGLFRSPEGAIGPLPEAFAEPGLAEKLLGASALSQTVEAPAITWGNPVAIGPASFSPVRRQLVRDGEIRGYAIALVGQHTRNRLASRLGRERDMTIFMLDATGAMVLAHSRLPGEFRDREAVTLESFPDERLKLFSASRVSPRFQDASNEGVEVRISDDRDGYVFVTKQIVGYSEQPFMVGAYFAKAQIGAEIARAMGSLVAGLGALALAVVVAILFGKRITRPLAKIAEAASAFSDFRLDDIAQLPRSRIREIDDQVAALNTLREVMHEFVRYVPRQFVSRLIRSGDEAKRPVEREVTILFTDIAGFTSLSERMSAAETARLLNGHFSMTARHVGETGGVIDKFMGDGMMAFWGAPEADRNHALNAVETVRKIAQSLELENAARKAGGEPPIRVRMGLHTGRVVVGNIGGEDRQNYTIVGDAVNVAQRLEQMGKELMEDEAETIVLASAILVERSGQNADFVPAGSHIVRGRERPVAVCRLELSGGGASNVVPFSGTGSA